MPWSVYAWLDGENAVGGPIVDLHDAATELGGFVAALRRVVTTGGPRSLAMVGRRAMFEALAEYRSTR